MTAKLITIPFSHYCEKARWALELCGVPYVEDGHLPIKRALNVTPAGAARSEEKVDATFERVDALLADGRPYLCGERFTVADLTLAALAAPVLQPPEHPHALPGRDFTGAAQAKAVAWRTSPAGRHALAMYARHRHQAVA